jgi:hypothetical protein
MIPGLALHAVSRNVWGNAELLVLIPLLWTGSALGLSFFIDKAREGLGLISIVFFVCLFLLPFLAATVYWVFFAQHFFLGYLLLIITLFPMILTLGVSFFRVMKK